MTDGGFSPFLSHRGRSGPTDRQTPALSPFSGARRHLPVQKALRESPPSSTTSGMHPECYTTAEAETEGGIPDVTQFPDRIHTPLKAGQPTETSASLLTPFWYPGHWFGLVRKPIYSYFPHSRIHLSGSQIFKALSDSKCTSCQAARPSQMLTNSICCSCRDSPDSPFLGPRVLIYLPGQVENHLDSSTGQLKLSKGSAWGLGRGMYAYPNDRLNLLIFITTWEFFKTRRAVF